VIIVQESQRANKGRLKSLMYQPRQPSRVAGSLTSSSLLLIPPGPEQLDRSDQVWPHPRDRSDQVWPHPRVKTYWRVEWGAAPSKSKYCQLPSASHIYSQQPVNHACAMLKHNSHPQCFHNAAYTYLI